MKKMKLKKLFAVVTVIAMVLGMLTTVYAEVSPNSEPTYSITINTAEDGHTYEAYQIFSGNLATDGKVLSNIEWGTGVNPDTVSGLLKFGKSNNESFEDAAELAAYLSDADNSSQVTDFAIEANKYLASTPTASTTTLVPAVTADDGSITAEAHYTIPITDPGYYLIKDKDNSLNSSKTYTSYMIQVLGKVSIQPKTSTPTLIKKVQDSDSTAWQDSADYSIGKDIPFQLTATVPENLSNYSSYNITFHDKADKGFNVDTDSIKVKLGNKEIAGTKSVSNKDGCNFEVTIDLLSIEGISAGSEITVDYTAQLNEDAVIAGSGNVNTSWLTYPNNPNNLESIGETPKDQVVVFTYKFEVTKRDGETGTPGDPSSMDKLSGATFTLYSGAKSDANKITTFTLNNDKNTFTWTGLGDGTYILEETTPPDGFNKAEDIVFTISAEHEATWASGKDSSSLLGSITTTVTSGNATIAVASSENDLTRTISTNVVDYKGNTLPSAGGMGTRLLYLIGALLVLFAGTMLVAKKRTGSER
jgi:fimbrial isopeptide formation D2 family protein